MPAFGDAGRHVDLVGPVIQLLSRIIPLDWIVLGEGYPTDAQYITVSNITFRILITFY